MPRAQTSRHKHCNSSSPVVPSLAPYSSWASRVIVISTTVLLTPSIPVPTSPCPVCRQSFNAQATLDGGLELQSVHRAADGTCKMLFKLKVRSPVCYIAWCPLCASVHTSVYPCTSWTEVTSTGSRLHCTSFRVQSIQSTVTDDTCREGWGGRGWEG